MAKSGKKKTVKIPKEIAGFRIPKDLRKSGEALIAQASSPAGRQAITAGLAVAATAAVAAVEQARAKKQAEADAPKRGPDAAKPETAARPQAGEPGTQSPQAVADAIGQAAEMMIGRFFGKKA